MVNVNLFVCKCRNGYGNLGCLTNRKRLGFQRNAVCIRAIILIGSNNQVVLRSNVHGNGNILVRRTPNLKIRYRNIKENFLNNGNCRIALNFTVRINLYLIFVCKCSQTTLLIRFGNLVLIGNRFFELYFFSSILCRILIFRIRDGIYIYCIVANIRSRINLVLGISRERADNVRVSTLGSFIIVVYNSQTRRAVGSIKLSVEKAAGDRNYRIILILSFHNSTRNSRLIAADRNITFVSSVAIYIQRRKAILTNQFGVLNSNNSICLIRLGFTIYIVANHQCCGRYFIARTPLTGVVLFLITIATCCFQRAVSNIGSTCTNHQCLTGSSKLAVVNV